MTVSEGEWVGGQLHPVTLLLATPGLFPSPRKARLAAVAVCRTIWDHLPTAEQRLIESVEDFADGRGTWRRVGDRRRVAARSARKVPGETGSAERRVWSYRSAAAWAADRDLNKVLRSVVFVFPEHTAGDGPEEAFGSRLVSDIFGNPFRPIVFDPVWQTPTVETLAAGIYAARAFDQLPILADALEDAGCDAAELLAHLRGPGPHARGCWALDLVLGKS